MAKRVIGKPGATKGRRLPPEPLTQDEVRALLRGCSNRAPSGVRNKALIVTLWRSGLRISEALGLMEKDVDSQTSTLRVLHGKGDKSRTVGMDAEGFAVLQRWLDRRRLLGLNGRHPIFSTLHGRPLATAYIRALLPRLAARVGIEKRVHPHGLRHTMASELADEGVPLPTIQAQLGHASAATTARYIARICPKQLVEAMRGRSWGSGQDSTL